MQAPQIFISYAHADEAWCKKVITALRALEGENLARLWLDEIDLENGKEFAPNILKAIRSSHIFLLLVSSEFIESDFCFSIESRYAIRRRAMVVPIILRPCDYTRLNFGKYPAMFAKQPLADRPDESVALQELLTTLRKVTVEVQDSRWRRLTFSWIAGAIAFVLGSPRQAGG